MTESIYVTAVNTVPKGETRSFGQIAALAGKPMAARAAGRTLTSYPVEGKAAWQRAVTARGGFSIDPIRADWQLQKLRSDGARPRENETIERWAKRVGAGCVGNWRNGQYFSPLDPRLAKLDPQFVERLTDEARARARGFMLAQAVDVAHTTLKVRSARVPSGAVSQATSRPRSPKRVPTTITQSPPVRPRK
ncbi:MAG: MGMT family protein [Planctomycetota bacterium]|nr:MGMT family protein [Planctomycetota bacterium]